MQRIYDSTSIEKSAARLAARRLILLHEHDYDRNAGTYQRPRLSSEPTNDNVFIMITSHRAQIFPAPVQWLSTQEYPPRRSGLH